MYYSTAISRSHFISLRKSYKDDFLVRTHGLSVSIYVNNETIKFILEGIEITGYFRELKVCETGARFEINFKVITDYNSTYCTYFTYESTRYMSCYDHIYCITRMFVNIQREQIRLLCLVIKRFAIKKRLPDELEWSIGEYVITEFVK